MKKRGRRNGLMRVAGLPSRTRVMSEPGLLPTAISGSATARVYIDVHDPCFHQGHRDTQSVDYHLWPLWYPWAMPPPGPC